MGLDTYAGRRRPTGAAWDDEEFRFGLTDDGMAAFERAEAEIEAEEDGDVYLFGGNYFTGSVVAELVELVTGVRLYREWILPETVCSRADVFDDCDPEATIREYMGSSPRCLQSEVTIEELRRFFQICAARHLGLVGSW